MKRIIASLVITFCFTLVHCQPKVPCYFIFGDSLSDAGRNNDLDTLAKVNYPPYGVDFPGGVPTGRFTNGRTVVDFLSRFIGFENFIPPYSTQMGQDIESGVNFASGAAGILNDTSSQLGDRIWMDRQLEDYEVLLSELEHLVEGPVADYINKCLYTLNIGSNDYINNYFLPENDTSRQLYTHEQFAELLIAQYKRQLQAIYNSGARKFALFGLGQIGCIPAELIRNKATKCVDEINQAVDIFNQKLRSLVDYFNANLPGAKFTFIDISAMQTLVPLPASITATPCCTLRSDLQCEPFTRPCIFRDLYAFMDGFHPTEVVNRLLARLSYNPLLPFPSFSHPMDISELISS